MLSILLKLMHFPFKTILYVLLNYNLLKSKFHKTAVKLTNCFLQRTCFVADQKFYCFVKALVLETLVTIVSHGSEDTTPVRKTSRPKLAKRGRPPKKKSSSKGGGEQTTIPSSWGVPAKQTQTSEVQRLVFFN